MRTRHLVRLLAGAFTVLCASSALAADPIYDTSGKLIGATGVLVGNSPYNVSFELCQVLNGSFTPGCTATFNTSADATDALDALIDQVLDANDLSTEPGYLVVPYTSAPLIDAEFSSNNGFGWSTPSYFAWYDRHIDNPVPFLAAVFTPEPGTWALMLMGFIGIGLALRRTNGLAIV